VAHPGAHTVSSETDIPPPGPCPPPHPRYLNTWGEKDNKGHSELLQGAT